MKQSGKMWIDAKGIQIQATRVTAFEKFSETYGQRIIGEALAIESRMQAAKAMFLKYGEEMLTRKIADNKKASNSVTFYLFDKTFKIIYWHKERTVRVFRATKTDPTSEEYTEIVLAMNSSQLEATYTTESPSDSKLAKMANRILGTSDNDIVKEIDTFDETVASLGIGKHEGDILPERRKHVLPTLDDLIQVALNSGKITAEEAVAMQSGSLEEFNERMKNLPEAKSYEEPATIAVDASTTIDTTPDGPSDDDADEQDEEMLPSTPADLQGTLPHRG